MRNLITDVPGVLVGHGRTCASARAHRRRIRRAGGRLASTCAAAGPARARPTCSSRPPPSIASTRSPCRADRPSVSRPRPACRPGCASAAAALRCAPPGCRSCRARSCSICSPAATRTGAASRPIAISAMRRPPLPRPNSRSAASAPASAPPRSTSRAASARRRRQHAAARVGALAAVNAAGSVVIGGGPWFWAAPFEQDAEFGGLGMPATLARCAGPPHQGRRAREHHPGGGGDRRGADQGTGPAPRRDGANRASRERSIRCTPRSTATWCLRPRPAASRSATRSLAWRTRPAPPMRWPARWRAPSSRHTALPLPGAMRSWQDEFGR